MTRGEVRAAGEADIDAICRLLHEQMNSRLAPERWRRLMTYRWLEEKPDLGRVAVADGRIVGYVGSVHADRQLPGAGGRHRVVNICAWYLDKAYRGRGLGFELMRQATADPEATYTNLTSSARTLALLDAIGYRILDTERRLWWRSDAGPAGLSIERDPARISAAADAAQRRMLEDHAELPVTPVLISEGSRRCLAIFSVKKKRQETLFYDALHIADAGFFAQRAQAIADALLPRDGPAALAVDARLLGSEHAPGGEAEPLPVARYYKSARLAPGQIDNMYSELQLLDLKLD